MSTKKMTESLLVLVFLYAAPRMFGSQVTYEDATFGLGATIGSNTIQCAGVPCAAIDIKFFSDTTDVVPFSVPGASGYQDFTGTGTVTISNGVQTYSANFLPGQIYVSIDQTNEGIGFGSAGEPTYPLATYGGIPSTPYSVYDLTSNFSVTGFSWFCPDAACFAGPILQTDQGAFQVIPTGPITSIFTATVEPVATPEPPSAMLLVAVCIALLSVRRGHRLMRSRS